MRVWKDVLKKNRVALLLFVLTEILNLGVFLLYGILTEAFLYPFVLSLLVMIAYLCFCAFKEARKAAVRQDTKALIASGWKNLPAPETLAEEDFEEMIRLLGNRLEEVVNETERKEQNQLDYYTSWVHQIKTPIAVMKLKLSEETAENRALRSELFRIEQYVDMVLEYMRLESRTTDLVIRKYSLDDLIRRSIRKHAGQFIEKKLKIEYEPTDESIVTDEKSFSCILDQLISNAVKYTKEGGVTISVRDSILSVSDTGVGIAPEDLPRIFEKGFTGVNGRIGDKSSGLGLYLTKRAADQLSIRLKADSTLGVGSVFSMDLSQPSRK